MKTAGIICEYNPFHLGHARQLRLTREILGDETAIICVMSGNYVQRGVPAMWDKFTRADAAVACGADVVLELPITAVLRSAEGFAAGGVRILSAFGVDYLSFGAESADGERLMTFARQIDTDEYSAAFRQGLNAGLSYAAARQQALGDDAGLLSMPNNILGLEYCRAILCQGSRMQPLVIHRNGDYHAQIAADDAPSATAVRKLYPDGDWRRCVPPAAAERLSGQPWYDFSFGERAVLARLRALTEEEWSQCAHGSEGLWSKAMKAARSCSELEAILDAVKSKRYPRTRIQRLLLCAYLGITQEQLTQDCPYVRILALSQRGRRIIREAKTVGPLTIINPGQTPPAPDYYALETRASDLFTLFCAPGPPPVCRMEQDARLF